MTTISDNNDRREATILARAALGGAPDAIQATPFWGEIVGELDRLEAAELAPIEKRPTRD